jgi:hypothetical protein
MTKIKNFYNSALHSSLVAFLFFKHITQIYAMKIHFIPYDEQKQFLFVVLMRRANSSLFEQVKVPYSW